MQLRPRSLCGATRPPLEREGRRGQFAASYQRPYPARAKSGEAFRQRAQFYSAHTDFDLAIKDYDKAIELDQTDIEAWRGKAQAYLRVGRSDDALTFYKQVVELNRLDTEAVEAVAKLCVGTKDECGDYHAHASRLKKINELSEQITREPGNRQALLERAEAYNGNWYDRYPREFDRALQDYNAVLRLYPTDGDALVGRAHAYHHKEDHASEMADYNELIQREPGNNEWLMARVSACYAHNNWDQAVQDLTEVLNRDPNNAQALVDRSDVYKKLGQKKLADQDMKEFKRLQKRK